ncbi:MAG: DNA-directed RNA polymerase specialized sigma24 family protein, partial [Candidatus Azotimanducaceae bacterium]
MMTIEESFLRYRNHGDVKALGDVFDAVAEELALVAAHLMPTGVEAEDLVQVTFVEAIEHAERY